jgi:hypothetical protein
MTSYYSTYYRYIVGSDMKAGHMPVDYTPRMYGLSLSSYVPTYTNFEATSKLSLSLQFVIQIDVSLKDLTWRLHNKMVLELQET